MEIKTQYDKVVVSNMNGNWQTVNDIDFGGLNVEFEDFAGNLHNNTTITSITNGVLAHQSARSMFDGYTNLKIFDLDISNVEDCKWMFGDCVNLRSQELTLNAIDASYMFDGCKAMGWAEINMPNVTDASYMFSRCEDLTEFTGDCRSVVNFGGMFRLCTRMVNIEIITTNSELSADDITVYPDAPCRRYRYVDDIGGGLYKVTFTYKARPELNWITLDLNNVNTDWEYTSNGDHVVIVTQDDLARGFKAVRCDSSLTMPQTTISVRRADGRESYPDGFQLYFYSAGNWGGGSHFTIGDYNGYIGMGTEVIPLDRDDIAANVKRFEEQLQYKID